MSSNSRRVASLNTVISCTRPPDANFAPLFRISLSNYRKLRCGGSLTSRFGYGRVPLHRRVESQPIVLGRRRLQIFLAQLMSFRLDSDPLVGRCVLDGQSGSRPEAGTKLSMNAVNGARTISVSTTKSSFCASKTVLFMLISSCLSFVEFTR